jgi:hypothetical protein
MRSYSQRRTPCSRTKSTRAIMRRCMSPTRLRRRTARLDSTRWP